MSAVNAVKFSIEIEQEQDERWIAEALELPGVMTKGSSPADAKAHVQVLAFRVVADQLRAIPERRQAEIDAETC